MMIIKKGIVSGQVYVKVRQVGNIYLQSIDITFKGIKLLALLGVLHAWVVN